MDLQLAIFHQTLGGEGLRGLQFLKESNTPGNKRYLVSLLRWQCDGISFIKESGIFGRRRGEKPSTSRKKNFDDTVGGKKKSNHKQPLQDIPRYCLVANTAMRRETPKVRSGAEETRDALQCRLVETSPPVG